MGKAIIYSKGQELGPYCIKYIKEVEPYIASNGKKVRQAEFECPHCEEHKHFIARISFIKNGHTSSCGCRQQQNRINTIKQYNSTHSTPWNYENIAENQVVNEYGTKYIQDTEPLKDKNNKVVARKCIFKCPYCGDLFEALLSNVKRGLTKGCGKHASQGETKIISILTQNNISFTYQKTFTDLLGKSNHPYFFDFYLPDYNCCIEYDGIQHFEYRKNSNNSWNNYKNFTETQHRDNIKNNYCLLNNIILIRIPYTHLSNLKLEDLLPDTSNFIYKGDEINALCQY